MLETELLCCQGQPSKSHVGCLQIMRFSFKGPDTLKVSDLPVCVLVSETSRAP